MDKRLYVGKKKIQDINYISIYNDILIKFGYNFTEDGPDMWTPEETKLFSLVTELEDNLKDTIIKLIIGDKEVSKNAL